MPIESRSSVAVSCGSRGRNLITFSGAAREPAMITRPRTSSPLANSEPRIDVRATTSSPADRANSTMKSSGRLPSVDCSAPVTAGPNRSPTDSVAIEIAHARPPSAIAATTNTSTGSAPAKCRTPASTASARTAARMKDVRRTRAFCLRPAPQVPSPRASAWRGRRSQRQPRPAGRDRLRPRLRSLLGGLFWLAEREHVCLDAVIGETELERALVARPALPDQLVEPLLDDGPVSVLVVVESVRVAGWFAVDEDLVRHGRPVHRRAEDEVDVARVEAERDPSVGLVQHARTALDRPVAGERPLVEPQRVGHGVVAGLV